MSSPQKGARTGTRQRGICVGSRAAHAAATSNLTRGREAAAGRVGVERRRRGKAGREGVRQGGSKRGREEGGGRQRQWLTAGSAAGRAREGGREG